MDIFVAVSVFFSVALFEAGGFLLINSYRGSLRGLQRLQGTVDEPAIINILRKDALRQKGRLDRILSRGLGTDRIKTLLTHANVQYSPGLCILISVVMAMPGLWLGGRINTTTGAALGFLTGMAPFFYLLYKKRYRSRRFEEQLPEAAEMIARAMRAGHSFTTGLQMVAEEMPEPIGNEFKKVFREISYMKTLSQALESLSGRVDCENLKFFAAAASIQEGIGGNMAELLDNTAAAVRQRLKLQAQVRALSAEGRFAAIIMIALPIGLAFLLYSFTRHLEPLFTDTLGRKIVMAAIGLMTMGVIIIKKLTDIKI